MSDFTEKAGAFANRAAGKARSFAKHAANKTKKLSRIAKLNVDISGQRDAIRRAYAEIGKLYYEQHKDAREEAMEPVCQKVDEALATIASLEAEIERLKTEEPSVADDADFESVVEADEEDADPDITVEITEDEQDAPTDGEADFGSVVDADEATGDAPEAAPADEAPVEDALPAEDPAETPTEPPAEPASEEAPPEE